MIICNRSYDKKYVTHDDLPAVLDDFKNAMQTVKMMGILPENIFKIKDASYEELENHMAQVHEQVSILSLLYEASLTSL